MNHLLTILTKGLIAPFYRSHAGLLLFVFFVTFGLVESNQLINYHTSLIEGMFTTPIFMTIVFGVWTLYSIKTLQFTISLFKQPEYRFLTALTLLSKTSVFLLLLLINGIAFLPVQMYTIFIYKIGIVQGYYLSCALIFLFQLALCGLNAWVILFFLSTQHTFSWSLPQLKLSIPGRTGFYINYFIADGKIAVLLSKVFSVGLLYVVRETTEIGDDFRIFGIAWLFALLSHTFLTIKLREFDDRYLVWIKGLPLAVTKTYVLFFILYAGLMLPEFVLLITALGKGVTVAELFLLLLLSGGLLMFIHTYLLKSNRDPEKFSGFLFWLFMLSFLAILSKLIILLVIVLGIASYLRMTRRYYEYEPSTVS
jgi:hypothetical protein